MKWYRSKAIPLALAVAAAVGMVIYGMSFRVRAQMERAAADNVREIVQIIESGIAEIRENDLEAAELIAAAFSPAGDAGEQLARLRENSPFQRLSFVKAGTETGISSDGRAFSAASLPYAETALGGETSVSSVYMSDFGAWTYTVQHPVYDGGKLAGGLYADLCMERYDNILPGTIFQNNGLVYLLDAETLRFIYEPTGTNVFISSKYDLHGFFSDFGILDDGLEQRIGEAIGARQSTIARMQVGGAPSYVYFWPVGGGEWYLCGIIPESSIQGEGKAVTQTIVLSGILIFAAAALALGLFYWYGRKERRARQYQIALFNGVAKSIDDVVLLYDCGTGRLELAFDNILRVLGIAGPDLSGRLRGEGDGGPDSRLLRLLQPETFLQGREISEKLLWRNPETGQMQYLMVETYYTVLTEAKKCIVSILDITKEERMQESLRASALAAQNASQVKSGFLSRMSHEIRTPMNAVLGMAQIAEAKIDDRERALDCLHKIELSSRHLLGLINDILDISKIESQKMSLSETWFELDDFLSGLNNIISVQAGAKRQRFAIHNLAGSVTLLADKMRLSQVLMNLLNNAVKYTPECGAVSLTVDMSPSTLRDFGCLHFRVQDNGIGMSDAFREKLFTPFEREDDQAVRAQTGTGLGLAIVQSMVSLMGGSLRVESEKGVGTAFYVDVDFRYRAAEQRRQDDAPPPETCDLSGLTVLLAEDNELNREIAAEFLQMANARVECAADGVEAFEKFSASAENHFSMILMDMQMPRWDGLASTRRIRALARADAKTVPIIAVTANAYFEDEQKCREAGMNDHVAKPLEMRVLYQKIEKYLPGMMGKGTKP